MVWSKQTNRKFEKDRTLIALSFFAIFQKYIYDSISTTFLGALAGFELNIFRKLGTATINDGIMTGNTKNFINLIYDKFVNHSDKFNKELIDLGSVIIIFIFGVVFGSVLSINFKEIIMWFAFISTSILFIWLKLKINKV